MKIISLTAFLIALISFPEANAQTEFSYQGRLVDQGAPADGTYDLLFDLFDQPVGGTPLAGSVQVEDLSVINGFFVTEVDFGSVFDGTPRWIEVQLRPGPSTGSFSVLSPRQPITLAPMALISDEALVAGEVAWPNVTGVPVDLEVLATQVAALQMEVDALTAGTAPFVLGVTSDTSNGQFSFGGFFGTRAATEMCKTAFPEEPSAHLCTLSELEQAIATSRWETGNQTQMDEVWTWTASALENTDIPGGVGGSLGATCQNFLEFTSDQSRGTRVQLDFDYDAVGNSAGATSNVVKAETEIGCNAELAVLCCR